VAAQDYTRFSWAVLDNGASVTLDLKCRPFQNDKLLGNFAGLLLVPGKTTSDLAARHFFLASVNGLVSWQWVCEPTAAFSLFDTDEMFGQEKAVRARG